MYGGVLFVNVGSVGRPKDGDPRAMYTLLWADPGGQIEVETVRVSYDVEAVARRFVRPVCPRSSPRPLRRGA